MGSSTLSQSTMIDPTPTAKTPPSPPSHEKFAPRTTLTFASAPLAYTLKPSTHIAFQGSASKISLSLPLAEYRFVASSSLSLSTGRSLRG